MSTVQKGDAEAFARLYAQQCRLVRTYRTPAAPAAMVVAPGGRTGYALVAGELRPDEVVSDGNNQLSPNVALSRAAGPTVS